MRRFGLALALAGVLQAAPSLLGLPGALTHAGEDTPFLWLAAAPDGNGGALLRYTEPPADYQVVAGPAAHTVPRAAWSRCYEGDVAPILAAARDRGRIEHLEWSRQSDIHELKVWFDDLGSPMERFHYRCGPEGVSPLREAASIIGILGGAAWLVLAAAAAAAAGLGLWWSRRRARAAAGRAGRAA